METLPIGGTSHREDQPCAIFQRGTHFGKHQIVRLLGAGQVAEVYEESSRRAGRGGRSSCSRRTRRSRRALVARLSQEGDVIATIEHVNVVRYYDVGIEQGRVWLLLELVEGPDLGQLARSAGGALPVEQAVSIVRQACEGVAAAHALRIFHRDLRPENILVTPDDGAKVADFGSAKLAGWGVKTSRELDLSASLYAAPEYVKDGKATDRSDVYAMGCVLYEVLAGAHVRIPRAATPLELFERQRFFADPPRLDTLRRDVPGDLADVVQRALATDPARRGSMRDLADALAGVLRGLHVGRRAAARSLPLPNREIGLAMTEPAIPVFSEPVAWPLPVVRATALPPEPTTAPPTSSRRPSVSPVSAQPVSVQPVSVQPASVQPASAQPASVQSASASGQPMSVQPAPWVRARSSRRRRCALPVLQALPVTIAMSAVGSVEERRSSAAPVERTVPAAAARPRSEALGPAIGMGALLLLGLLSVGWMVVRPGLGGRVAPGAASASPGGSASAAPAGSASAARRRPSPVRVKLPAP